MSEENRFLADSGEPSSQARILKGEGVFQTDWMKNSFHFCVLGFFWFELVVAFSGSPTPFQRVSIEYIAEREWMGLGSGPEGEIERACAKPEAAVMPPPGVQPAVVNAGSWVGPVFCHLKDAVDKVNVLSNTLILHPLGSAAYLLHNSGCDGHCSLWSVQYSGLYTGSSPLMWGSWQE